MISYKNQTKKNIHDVEMFNCILLFRHFSHGTVLICFLSSAKVHVCFSSTENSPDLSKQPYCPHQLYLD